MYDVFSIKLFTTAADFIVQRENPLGTKLSNTSVDAIAHNLPQNQTLVTRNLRTATTWSTKLANRNFISKL